MVQPTLSSESNTVPAPRPSGKAAQVSRFGLAVLHHVPDNEVQPVLTGRIQSLQENGQQVVVVTPVQSVSELLRSLADVPGIDGAALGFVDCTGKPLDGEPGDNARFVESPAALQSALVNVNQILREMGDGAQVLVHALDAFVSHSSPEQVAVFAHNLANNVRGYGADVEFFAADGTTSTHLAVQLDAVFGAGASQPSFSL